ncbi:MAG TPA: endonuclease/exonuclease/phosphatase family protein [Streptosporangiaceae bacterium]|nr:endonuclease/exonuclease/phosphatase family protein [Streptosporangiaceae bacterium]
MNATAADDAPLDRIRVVSLNILDPVHADWPRRREVLRTGLQALDADVVALQEVVRDDDHDTVRDLLGEGWQVVWNSRHAPGGTGAALASRWPIGDIREVDEPVSARATRSCVWCTSTLVVVEAPAPFGPVVVVHHKPTWPYTFEYERELQAVATARAAEEVLTGGGIRHAILLGDLDATPDSASIRFLTGRQSLHGMSVCYRDAWEAVHPHDPGHTFTPRNRLVRAGDMPADPGRRIDYVMVRCGHHGPTLDVVDCRRLFVDEIGGVQASDHYGVLADLTPPARPPAS